MLDSDILINKLNTMKEFTKNDLKTGMRVKTEEGIMYIVLIGDFKIRDYSDITNMLVNTNSLIPLYRYNDNLIDTYRSDEYTIDEVYDSPSNTSPIDMLKPSVYGKLLWERNPKLVFKDFIESKGINWDKFKENCKVENQRWGNIDYYKNEVEYLKLEPKKWLSNTFNWDYNIIGKTIDELIDIDDEWMKLCKNNDNIIFE